MSIKVVVADADCTDPRDTQAINHYVACGATKGVDV